MVIIKGLNNNQTFENTPAKRDSAVVQNPDGGAGAEDYTIHYISTGMTAN